MRMEYGGGVTHTTAMARFSNQSFVQVCIYVVILQYNTLTKTYPCPERKREGGLFSTYTKFHARFLFYSVHYLQEGVHCFAKSVSNLVKVIL